MVRKSTLIIVIIFLVALGLVIIDQQSSNGLLIKKMTPTVSQNLIENFKYDSIIKIQISDSLNDPVIINKNVEENKWYFEINDKEVDQSQVMQFLTTLSVIEAKTEINESIPLESIGLEQPKYQINLFDKSGAETNIEIGDETPTQSGYYIRVNNKNIAVAAKNSIDLIINSYNQNTFILTTATPTISIFATPSSP